MEPDEVIVVANSSVDGSVELARYYMKTEAYVAALNRARASLEQYNGAASNNESLQIMIEAYEGLGMLELAADTQRVLDKNTRVSPN